MTMDMNLGVDLNIQDGELVKSCVVIANVVGSEGGERIEIDWTEGMSFVERAGMLRVAEQMDYYERRREDDDDE